MSKITLGSIRLSNMVQEGIPIQHTLRFYLESVLDPLDYDVSKEDSERLQLVLSEWKEGEADTLFFCFDSGDKSVVINLSYVEMVNFIYNPADEFATMEAIDVDKVVSEESDIVDDDSDGNLLIKIISRLDPFIFYIEDSQEFYNFYFHLDSGFFDEEIGGSNFESFVDENGEEVMIDVRRIVYLEASSDMIEEGNTLWSEEHDEGKE